MCSTGSAWALPQAGCPIRRSPDQRLLAATRGLSQQRYVLHRPLVPRHPPCALSSLTFLSSLDNERSNTRDIARLVKMRRHVREVNMAPRRLIQSGKVQGQKSRGAVARGGRNQEGFRVRFSRPGGPRLGAECASWWRWPGSNRRPPACKAGALPPELHPRGTGHGGPFWIRTRDLTVISRALSPTELKARGGAAQPGPAVQDRLGHRDAAPRGARSAGHVLDP